MGEVRYVNGRRAVLQMLDSLLADEKNIRTLHDAFQVSLDEKPLNFYLTIVAPLLPKQIALTDEEGEDTRTFTVQLVPAEAKDAPQPFQA